MCQFGVYNCKQIQIIYDTNTSLYKYQKIKRFEHQGSCNYVVLAVLKSILPW